jgi:hypothetical protein
MEKSDLPVIPRSAWLDSSFVANRCTSFIDDTVETGLDPLLNKYRCGAFIKQTHSYKSNSSMHKFAFLHVDFGLTTFDNRLF